MQVSEIIWRVAVYEKVCLKTGGDSVSVYQPNYIRSLNKTFITEIMAEQ